MYKRQLTILADVVRHPALAQGELDRLRTQELDGLSVEMQEPNGLARLVIPGVVFGGGPYGQPSGGSATSLARITQAQIQARYARFYRPDNAVLVLTGDIEPEAGFTLAQQAFADWANPPAMGKADASGSAPSGRRVVVVDLPGTGQASVTVVGRSIGRNDPDFHAVEVANAVLGGGYSSRLNEEIRIKRGLSYGSGSQIATHRNMGLFEAWAKPVKLTDEES